MVESSRKEFQICLVGAGGVGGVAAVVLEKSGRANVTTVLRSSYNIVKEKGWDIESVDHGSLRGWRPSRITATVEDAAFSEQPVRFITTPSPTPPEASRVCYDYVVLSTKQLPEKYDVSALIKPLVTASHTTIVLIQNGLNIHLPLIAAFPTNVTCSAVSLIGSFTTGPNQISQIGADVLQIGPHYHAGVPDEISLQRTQTFIDMYRAGGSADCTLAPDMMEARWRKLLWNGTFNTVCALMGMDVGSVLRAGGRETLIIPMMKEIEALAKADGHELPAGTLMATALWSKETSVYKPSMLLDRQQNRPMEFEVILGHPIEVAKNLGIDVPQLQTVYSLLKLARWTMESKSKSKETE